MRKVWVAGLVLVAVAVVVAWLLWRGETTGDEPGGATPSEVAAPVLAERANALLTAQLPPARGDRVIRGRVLGLDGPVEGAVVVASADSGEEVLSDLPCRCDSRCGQKLLECGCDGAAVQLVELVLERRDEAPPVARATSAADGSFTLKGLEEGTFALWAEKPGKLIGLRLGVKAGEEGADVEIGEGITLRGKTVGDEGKPVSASVTAIYARHSRFFDAVSGKDGLFTIGPVPVGNFAVVASAAGLLPSHGHATAGEPDLEELQLYSPRRIAGTVSRGGEPVAHATVSLEGGHKKAKADTDGKGHFEISGLRPQGYEIVGAQGLAQAHESVELKPGKDILDVQLSLSRGGDVVGSVKSESGAALADAEVMLWGNRRRSSQRSEASGRYRLGPMAPGKYHVTVRAEGYLSPDGRDVEIAEGATVTVDLALKAASPLKGVVVDEEGNPVEDATVAARAPGPPAREGDEDPERQSRRHEQHNSGEASSKHDGSFSVDGLVPGPYDVTVSHHEYRNAELTVTAPTTKVRVALARGLEIVGTVVDEDERPVVGAKVTAAPDDAGKEPRDREEVVASTKAQEATGMRGDFRIRGLEAGHWLVTASAGGWQESREVSARVEVRPGTPPSLRLKFEKGLTISGTVVTATGKPVAAVYVFANPNLEGAERPTHEAMREGAQEGIAKSAGDGTFAVKHLKPGAYLVSASRAPDYVDLEEPAKANAGDSDVKVVLKEGGKVRGHVVSASGELVTHFKIDFQDFRDDIGAFEVPSKGEGEQRLVVQADGFAEVTKKYESKKGEDADVGDIVLSKGRVVTGKVLDAQSGEPIGDALVDVGDPEQQKESDLRLATEFGAVKTNPDGTFTLPNVDARPLVIFASHPAHLFTGQPLPAEASAVTVRMERGAWIVGTVSDGNGKPVAQVMVMSYSAQGSLRTTTGADGRYRLGPLQPGKLSLAAFSKASANIPGRTVDVPATGEVQVDLREPTGGIQVLLALPGRLFPVLAPGDVPIPSKEEDLKNLVLAAVHPMPADPEERTFEASNVPAGTYTLVLIEPAGGTLKVARQVVQIAAEPALQKIAVPPPTAFTEIKMTGRGK